jgi:YD repeat-containing protein
MNYRDWLLVLALSSVGLDCLAATIYSYDALNRLTGVDYGSGKSISYSYDAAGNRLSMVVTTPVSVPVAPTIVDVTPGNGQVLVSFDAPASDGGSAITGYRVTCNPGNVVMTGSVSPIAVSGLTNGVGYSCTVAALNAIGTGVGAGTSFTLGYAVTAKASPVAGGSVICSPNPVNHGGSTTCAAAAGVGYTFGGFSGDCSGATCVLSNVTGDRNVVANFTLNGSLSISTGWALDFGSAEVGATVGPLGVVLRNPGGTAVSLSGTAVSGDFARSSGCGSSLAGGASCTINVSFTPTATGSRSGLLTINSSAPDSPQEVDLFGYGVMPLLTNGPVMVVPVVAQTASYSTEVQVRNGNPVALNLNVKFYEADNSAVPGQRTCSGFAVPANSTQVLSLGSQCTLGAGNHFGMLVLEAVGGTQEFTVYSRSQTPAGVGFSVEGVPIETFSAAPAYVEGLKRTSTGAKYQSNCFVGALASAVDYRIDLLTADNAVLGNAITGTLQPFHMRRYLDVLTAAGLASGDYADVRAKFTETGTGSPPFVGFCTVQESVTFSADFRVGKPADRAGSAVVVPVVAQTTSYRTEVFVRNGNAEALELAVNFYEADNSSIPGQRLCAPFQVPANTTRSLILGTQCALGSGNHFGMLILEEAADPQVHGFTVYSRSQTPAGAGFSVEGYPVANFGAQPVAVEGLKRTSTAPYYLANCFVGALEAGASYRLDLETSSGTPIGSALTGSLQANHLVRYLDVLKLAGAPTGDYSGVRAKFTQTSPGTTPMVGFCTMQESVTFGADFRIAK